ncbi:hypothetical protein ALC57_08981 [Trachymyrmex cornetzi]|uniref:Uncharacterized protein n=1 Tax=Trachymyrmex cornetzi TaxID=471704 RepID=A0A151J638_9HYME|nr:hypothetical protein ALC57_08981 [Trachymyrmex cornetzi]
MRKDEDGEASRESRFGGIRASERALAGAEAQRGRQSSTRFRGVAVPDGIIPRISSACEEAENEEKPKVRASFGVVTPTGLFISRENGTPCRAMPRRQRARDVNEFDDAHYGMPELAFHNTYIAAVQRRSP